MDRFGLVLAVVFGCVTTTVGTELRPVRMTGRDLGDLGHEYTLTYIALRRPVVFWADQNRRFYSPDDSRVVITDTFNNGEGETTLIQSMPEDQILFAIVLNDTFTYYTLDKFEGSRELPQVDLGSPDGEVISYTPHEPFTLRLQYNNLPSGFNLDTAMWFFNFIDHYRITPIIETAASFDRERYVRYMSPITSVNKGSDTEVSTELDFESQEGILHVMINYSNQDMDVYRGITLAIKQEQNPGPFPDDFIGVVTSLNGDTEAYCEHSKCSFLCDGYGKDVEKVEVSRVGDGAVLEPLYVFKNEWFVSSEYQVYPVTDYTQRFVCKATNKANKTAQKEITLFTLDY